MHSDAFDRFHEAESRLHRLDPRVKVLVSVLFILSNALLPDGAWAAFGLSWIVLLWANQLSSLGVDFSFRRSFIALPFALADYNAGRARVLQWNEGAATTNSGAFCAQIKFPGTRQYVAAVVHRYQYYRSVFPGSATP